MPSTSKIVAIPFKQIFVDPADNIRKGDLPKIKDLADQLKKSGQTTPVIVTNGEPGDQPYRLRAGFRRYAAFELNGWQNRDILVTVREHSGKNAAALAFHDTWSENVDRENIPALDKAEAVGRLGGGTYGPGGTEAKPLAREEIAEVLDLSLESVRLFERIHTKLSPLVKELLRKKEDVPARSLTRWALLKTEEEQLEAAHAWIAQKDELEKEGRQRRAPAVKAGKGRSGGDEDGEERSTGAVRPGKKVGKAQIPLSVHLEAAQHRASMEKNKAEKSYFEGMADAMRFVTGDLKQLPHLLKADYEAVKPEEEAEEDGEG